MMNAPSSASFRVDVERIGHGQSRIAFHLVPWDAELLGYPVAQLLEFIAHDHGTGLVLLEKFDIWSADNGIRFTCCRTPQGHLLAAQLLQDMGFRFIELNYRPVKAGLQATDCELADDSLTFETANPRDRDELVEIATSTFSHGRFHQDPALGPDLGNRRYGQWMANAFDLEHQTVVKCSNEGSIVGFFVVEEPNQDHYFWSLVGLAPGMEGRGLGTRMCSSMMQWLKRRGAQSLETSISSHNTPVLNLYVKLGWRFPDPLVTFHRHAIPRSA